MDGAAGRSRRKPRTSTSRHVAFTPAKAATWERLTALPTRIAPTKPNWCGPEHSEKREFSELNINDEYYLNFTYSYCIDTIESGPRIDHRPRRYFSLSTSAQSRSGIRSSELIRCVGTLAAMACHARTLLPSIEAADGRKIGQVQDGENKRSDRRAGNKKPLRAPLQAIEAFSNRRSVPASRFPVRTGGSRRKIRSATPWQCQNLSPPITIRMWIV